VVSAAERLLAGPQAGKTIAVVLADSGMKYLSTDLWTAARTSPSTDP
jgi:cysteine synthase